MIKALFTVSAMLINVASGALDEDAQNTANCLSCLDKSWKQCLKGNDFTVGKCCDPSAASGSADYCDPTW